MNCGCGGYNEIPIAPAQGQKDVELIAGPGMIIQDVSDTATFRFNLSTTEIEVLIAALTIVAKEAGAARVNPVMKGTIIDRIELTWTYNKAVVSQTLINSGILTPPSLGPGDLAQTYTGLSVTNDISFTLQGNDGLGLPGSIGSDIESILFGNEMILGFGTSRILSSSGALETFIDALATKVTKTSRVHTYFATGGVNQHHFVAYPKSYGLATFTKGLLSGGYSRLKNVAGTLKTDLGLGDVETDIIFTNPKGYAIEYYIYESLYDNQNDPTNAFTIS